MKKIFDSKIFIFILGALIFGTIGVVAGTINASNVDYKDDKNVSEALDGLYENLDTKMAISSFGTPKYHSNLGSRTANKTATISSLPKGKYIVIDRKGITWVSTSSYEAANTSSFSLGADYENINCTSKNCVIQMIGKHRDRFKPTQALSNGSIWHSFQMYIYYVEIKEETDTIKAYMNTGDYPTNGGMESLVAIPIN